MIKVGWPSSRSAFGVFALRVCNKDGTPDNDSSDDMESRGGDIAVSSVRGAFGRAREKRNGL